MMIITHQHIDDSWEAARQAVANGINSNEYMHGTGQTQYYQQDNSLQNNDGYNYNNYNDTTDGTSFTLTEANLKAYEEQERMTIQQQQIKGTPIITLKK